eukprot:scaffold8494_cov21-Tisochrysis_lutea.AAC.2
MGTVALTGVVDHMRATSASLRRYNVPPTPSAISSISKTFARKPMAAHKQVGTDVTVLQFSLWYLIPCLHWLCVRVLGVMAHKQGGLDYSLYIGWSCKADLIRATHKLVCHKLGSSASVLLFTRSCKQELQPDLDSREQGGAWEASVLHVHQPVVRCSHISDVANARLCCGIQDARQLTPSERVASNFSPLARGISPRTLEAFIPGGIKPGVTGQPMKVSHTCPCGESPGSPRYKVIGPYEPHPQNVTYILRDGIACSGSVLCSNNCLILRGISVRGSPGWVARSLTALEILIYCVDFLHLQLCN